MSVRPPSTRGERGSATVEVAVLAPALLLVVFTIIQVGLWSYARSLALGAAQEGLAVGRSFGSTAQAGRERAEQFLGQVAGDSLRDGEVTIRMDASTLEVDVRGRALSVLPGVPGLPVHQQARGPVEMVSTP